jgi:plasmid stabilization system protein ParE
MAQVRWTEAALNDLRAIHDYIARDSPAAATALCERIVAASDRVADLPFSGRRVPEFPESACREVLVGRYRVIYRPESAVLWILIITHGSRLLGPSPE